MRYVIAMSILMGLLVVPFTPWKRHMPPAKRVSHVG